VCASPSRWSSYLIFGFRGVWRRRGLLTSMFYSSSLSKVLGYADSDYVVENITIRIPP